MFDNIKHFLNTWGTNPFVVAIISSLLTLTIVFFGQIAHFLSIVLKWVWAHISKQGKHYTFERAYLTWIINQHRYLGLLPARALAQWGEEGRNVDLEKVYVSLHVARQREDKNWAETSIGDQSSWRKQPFLYIMLKKLSWFKIILSILIIFSVCIASIFIFHYSLTT